jgi:lysozyme family protein
MDFETAVRIVIATEGGLVDDPLDHGGLTKHGISQRAYPELDIRNLTVDLAKVIYRVDRWDPCKCDKLPDGLRLPVFDMAVNQGVGAAILTLQRAMGAKVDGVIGAGTLKACLRPDARARFTAARIMRYTNTKNFSRYGMGWVTRAVQAVLD